MYDNAPLILRLAKNKKSGDSIAEKVLGGMANVSAVSDFWEQNGLLFQLIAQNELHEFVMSNDEITGQEIAAFKFALKKIAEFFILCYKESERSRQAVENSGEVLPEEFTD